MYYAHIKDFEDKILQYTREIFKVYGNELELKLEDHNLLENEKGCLESSTAFGYLLEEFLVSKLERYTKDHLKPKDYKISRADGSTTNASYDCLSIIQDEIMALVNVKVSKRANYAISAINILYNDYVVTNPKIQKCFMILKVHYSIRESEQDGLRKIFIDNVTSFFLEEVDFMKEHKQDHRSWSQNYNANSGRLQASDAFRKTHKVDIKDISYENTCNMLKEIEKRNNH